MIHADRTLERFHQQRAAWERNPALRALYAFWYGEVKDALGERLAGDVLELGSGPGFSRDFLPGIHTSDTVKAPWHDQQLDATQPWPFGDFDLLFGASKLNLQITEVPIRYAERSYGRSNIQHIRSGLVLLRMCLYASRKIKFV